MTQKDLETAALKALEGTALEDIEIEELRKASVADLLELGYDHTDVVLIQNFVSQEKVKSELASGELQEIRRLIKSLLAEKIM